MKIKKSLLWFHYKFISCREDRLQMLKEKKFGVFLYCFRRE